MIRRILRACFKLALVLGSALAVFKVVQSRRQEPKPSLRAPAGPMPTAPPVAGADPASVAERTAAVRPSDADAVTATRQAEVTKPAGAAATPATEPWVQPDATGGCPSSHPVKAKLSSGIYHLAGMLAYDRTRPDRCYCDEAAAQSDGLRKAKR